LLQKAIEEARQVSPDLSSFRILFSAHGLPKKVIDAGDPYQAQVEACSAAIMSHIAAGIEWRNSYQSRVGPMEWIGPATDDEIKRAGAEGKSLIVMPIAFVSEHSETLVELDIEYGKLAKESGVPHYIRVPAVADHPLFIQGLARLVKEAEHSEAGIWPENAPGREALEKAGFRLIQTGPREKRRPDA